MNHLGTVCLETPRLLLRPFRVEDAEQMYANWASDDEVTRFLTWKSHKCVEDTRAWLAYRAGQYARAEYYGWCMTLKETGEIIGDLSVVRMDEAKEEAEIGWVLSRSHWGQGLAPEAGRAVLAFLLDRVGFHRVMACHDTQNPKSGRGLIKCGMRYEGTLRQAGLNSDGGHIDISLYSILRSDPRRREMEK